jgi:hypothetical protein
MEQHGLNASAFADLSEKLSDLEIEVYEKMWLNGRSNPKA